MAVVVVVVVNCLPRTDPKHLMNKIYFENYYHIVTASTLVDVLNHLAEGLI